MTYLNVVEIESALAGLASTYPSVTQLITLPFFTVQGRQSHALRIGTKTESCPRTAVLLISGVHAREWGGPDICINFATDLLEAWDLSTGLAYGGTSYTAAEIESIIERLDVIVFPDVNPDGRHYSQNTFPMCRKNRNPASGGAANKLGVDINRNYDFLWDFKTTFAPGAQLAGSLASTDPSDDLFHGTSPFSEAETKNVRWLFDQFPRISWFMDIHSYGADFLYSWGDDVDQTTSPDMNFTNPAWNGKRGLPGDAYGEYIGACDLAHVKDVAQATCAAITGVRGETYIPTQSFFLPALGATYPTSGASDDWAFSRYFSEPTSRKVHSFTMEFNKAQTFFPTWAQMQPVILDVDAGLVRFCLGAVPANSPADWWCSARRWLREAIWHRVFPPELWGPYGPWGRILSRVESTVYPIIAPILRLFGGGARGRSVGGSR